MRKDIVLLLVLVFATASCLIEPLPANATSKTLVVPDDYATINAAIENADDGDTILVKPGTYEGPINQTLTISRTFSIIGQDAKTTTLHLHPEWVTQIFITTPLSYYAFPLKIEANNVKISGLTITSDGGEIWVNGNRTKITKNIFHVYVSLNGYQQSFTENTLVGANVMCRGTYASINNNTALNGTIGSDSGSHDKIFANNVKGTIAIGGTSSYESVYGNTVSDNGENWAGISVASFGTIIANNTVTNCNKGISVDWGSSNIVCGNIIANNHGPALSISSGISDFVANHVENNLIGVQTGTAICALYHNNFINNNVQIDTADGAYFWSMDNGAEGNYWSDYAGKDANGDGIGDTRHVIKKEITDHFPLMQPFDISSVTALLAETDNVLEKTLEILGYTQPTDTQPTTSPSQSSSPSPPPSQEPTSSPEPHQPEPFPIVPVLTASLAAVAVGVGLLLYTKKRKR